LQLKNQAQKEKSLFGYLIYLTGRSGVNEHADTTVKRTVLPDGVIISTVFIGGDGCNTRINNTFQGVDWKLSTCFYFVHCPGYYIKVDGEAIPP